MAFLVISSCRSDSFSQKSLLSNCARLCNIACEIPDTKLQLGASSSEDDNIRVVGLPRRRRESHSRGEIRPHIQPDSRPKLPHKDPKKRILISRLGAHVQHSMYDTRETTSAARTSFLGKFESKVDPTGILPIAERKKRAAHLRKAYFIRLGLRSAKARAARAAISTAPVDR